MRAFAVAASRCPAGVLAAVGVLGAVASAAPHTAPPVIVGVPPHPFDGSPPRTLVVNRCAGGCRITTGPNDAAGDVSNIPKGTGTHTVNAFAFGDDEWAAVMTCMREVYSPYDIQIVEAPPTDPGTAWNEVMIAGLPQELGLKDDILGIAPLAEDCRVLADSIAFVFANNHPQEDRVQNICWTAAQESAHIYGLDHEYQFIDGTSACNDPMTYRSDCGGEKFFRDKDAECGEYEVRGCQCKGSQNSHRLLLAKFGAGEPITAPPMVSMVSPIDGSAPFTDGETVMADASAQRGVDRVTLVLNGYPWTSVPGAAFLSSGQPDRVYSIATPDGVPDGVIDVQVTAADDLGIATTTPAVTVTKGAPCADESTCLAGQHCGAGKCFWDPPTAGVGAACDYPQFCESGVCASGTCAEACDPNSATPQCSDGAVCDATSRTCTASGGGCCSVGGGPGAMVLAAIAGLVMSRGRRRW